MKRFGRVGTLAVAALSACSAQFKATGFAGSDPPPQATSKRESVASAAPAGAEAQATSPERPAKADDADGGAAPRASRSAALWLRQAPGECRTTLNHEPCNSPPEGITSEQVKECHAACSKEAAATVNEKYGQVLEDCLDRFVAGEGVKAVCADPGLPENADPWGKGEAITVEKRAQVRKECDKRCHEGGPKLIAAMEEQKALEKAGKVIVMAYKRCMFAVDSTPLAIRYRIHDRDLYDELMDRTDAECRKKHRCNELEDPDACAYGN